MTEQERQKRARRMDKEQLEEMERHIGHKFRMIHRAIDRYFTKQKDCILPDLTRAQSGMIHYLYDHRDVDIFQKDIEAVFSISGATATNCLKGMERLGLIRREVMPKDARLKRIVLTPEGVKSHERATENIRRMEEALTRGMTEEEIAIYRKLLNLSLHNVEQLQ